MLKLIVYAIVTWQVPTCQNTHGTGVSKQRASSQLITFFLRLKTQSSEPNVFYFQFDEDLDNIFKVPKKQAEP